MDDASAFLVCQQTLWQVTCKICAAVLDFWENLNLILNGTGSQNNDCLQALWSDCGAAPSLQCVWSLEKLCFTTTWTTPLRQQVHTHTQSFVVFKTVVNWLSERFVFSELQTNRRYNLWLGLTLALLSAFLIGGSVILKKKALLRLATSGHTRAGEMSCFSKVISTKCGHYLVFKSNKLLQVLRLQVKSVCMRVRRWRRSWIPEGLAVVGRLVNQ